MHKWIIWIALRLAGILAVAAAAYAVKVSLSKRRKVCPMVENFKS